MWFNTIRESQPYLSVGVIMLEVVSGILFLNIDVQLGILAYRNARAAVSVSHIRFICICTKQFCGFFVCIDALLVTMYAFSVTLRMRSESDLRPTFPELN